MALRFAIATQIVVVEAMPRTKMGIARADIDSNLNALRGTPISWANNWNFYGNAGAFQSAGVEYVPMVWGHQPLNLDGLPNAGVLLGFNEPNNAGQANMDPTKAAELWRQVEDAAGRHGVTTLVGPALNYAGGQWSDPEAWYQAFFNACPNCRVDAIAIHVYNCNVDAMRARVEKFRHFGRQLWVTEFACGDDPQYIQGCDGSKSWECQCKYMQQVIPYLENENLVSGYSWFSYGEPGNPDGYVGESALIVNGQLSQLGQCYANLARMTAINNTQPLAV